MRMQFKMTFNITSVICPIISSFYLCAQEQQFPCDNLNKNIRQWADVEQVEKISAFQPAISITQVEPKYPIIAAKAGAEGWVQMSYVIDVDGKVKDPVVEDFSGYKAFKRAALNAIEDWTFQPAIKDGKPTEQCHQRVQFDFTMGEQTGATRRFVRAYRQVNDWIKAAEYVSAEQKIQAMHGNNKNHNRYENAWLWRVDSVLAKKLGDTERELHSLQRTLASSASYSIQNQTFNDASSIQKKQH